MSYAKYKNKKTTIDNIQFASKRESERYLELKLMLRAGIISELVLQPKFKLQDGFKYEGKTERAITYIADFKYLNNETNEYIIEDVKGMETKEFKIKRKLFLYMYGSHYKFEIVR